MSDDPPRLRDDRSTPAWVREALQRSAAVPLVSPDTAAALARFQSRVATGGPPVAIASRAGRWTLGGIGVAAVLGALWLGTRPVHRANVRSERPASAPVRAVANPVTQPAPALLPVETPRQARAPEAPPPLPTRETRDPGGPLRAAPQSAHAPAPSDRDDVQREFAQLARVRAALEHGASAALALADAGNREFPHGMLAEERDALAIRALARLGRIAELHRRGAIYLQRFPRGIHTAEVRQALAAAPTASPH